MGYGLYGMDECRASQALFHGHYQSHIPADLGFYDLRMCETRSAQAGDSKETVRPPGCQWERRTDLRSGGAKRKELN